MAVENAFTQGLSVTRMTFAKGGLEAVMKSCKGYTTKPKKGESPLGVAMFTAGFARDLKIEGERAYYVFDTARQSNSAHADVVATQYFGDYASLSDVDRIKRTIMQVMLTKNIIHISH